MTEVRLLTPDEWDTALALARRVFMTFEAPDYPPAGVNAFSASLCDPEYLAGLRLYGAFDGSMLIGMLATRSGGTHIALFFVAADRQRQGVGRALFGLSCVNNPTDRMTVNAAPFAVPFYTKLGFSATDPLQETNGIRYIPMVFYGHRADCPCQRSRCSRHGNCVACREHHRTVKKSPVACERRDRRTTRAEKRRTRDKG